jgi:4-amino-4-deoxy-L-arabinose transferase-like glycosyltransferase
MAPSVTTPWRDASGVSRAPARRQLERWMVGVVAAGTTLRLLWVLLVHRPIESDYSDMHTYMVGALHFVDAQYVFGQNDFFYPSGTSFLLSLFVRLFGTPRGWTAAAVAQALLSGLEIGLLFLAARRFFGSRVAFVSATLLAFHYLAISYPGYFLSENWLSLCLVGACAAFVPGKPLMCLLAGALLGLGAWAKPPAFLLALLWGAWLLRRRKWVSAAFTMAGTLAIVLPISLLVSVRTGSPSFISTNGGQNFALGYCPIKTIAYSIPWLQEKSSFELPVVTQRAERGEVEATWPTAYFRERFVNSGFYFRTGLACIRQHPAHAARMVLLHAADTFAGPPWSSVIPWPDSGDYTAQWSLGSIRVRRPYRLLARTSNFFVSYVVLSLALLGAWRARHRAGTWALVVLPIVALLASTVAFIADPRFRVPYDFCLFVGAAVQIDWLIVRRLGAVQR